MTGSQYRSARLALGLTQRALADLLALNVHTVARRERGELPIPREAVLAIMALQSSSSGTVKCRRSRALMKC
jgi:transcriptional regulator with XRE-family HTH domain